jgi:hypothetical protein
MDYNKKAEQSKQQMSIAIAERASFAIQYELQSSLMDMAKCLKLKSSISALSQS